MKDLQGRLCSGVSTLALDAWIDQEMTKKGLKSKTKGFMTYRHVSCISVNDEVVHGVPSAGKILKDGDVVKVDICASWEGYCADMARAYFIGTVSRGSAKLALVAQAALIKELKRRAKVIDFQIFRQQFKKKLKGMDLALCVILQDMVLENKCMKILKY